MGQLIYTVVELLCIVEKCIFFLMKNKFLIKCLVIWNDSIYMHKSELLTCLIDQMQKW